MKRLDELTLEAKELQSLRRAALALKKSFPIETIVLFGSRSRGGGDSSSDLDLLLVAKRTLTWREEKAVIDILFEIGIEYDVIFSPLFVSKDEWSGEVFRQFPVYEDIVRDGALVA